jgi:hypothetical protein
MCRWNCAPTDDHYEGKYVQKQWMKNSPLPEDPCWACSPSGWTDNKLGVEYIKAFDRWMAAMAYVDLLLF